MLANKNQDNGLSGQQISKEETITRTFNNGSGKLVGEANTISHPIGNADSIKDPVAHLRALLGRDVVLLPIPKGEKGPKLKEWQKTRHEVMEDPAYLGRLQQGNIGVLLGKVSGDLCAIDIDNDAQVEPFLALNPGLRDTLRSKGARGVQIWVRVTTKYPKLTKLVTDNAEPWGEWRADGGQSVIHGLHPDGMEYRSVHEATPVEIKFEDIVWPENLKLPWIGEAGELTDTAGPPYEVSASGAIKLNHMFWIRRYMAEHTVVYDSALGEFFEYEEATGVWKKHTEERMKRRFMEELQQIAINGRLTGLHFKLNEGLAAALMQFLRTMAEHYDVFSERPQAIHVKNGMLCFEDDQLVLKTFAPDFYSRNVCPFDYDENAECPRFKKELLGNALSEEDVNLMQKWAGACLLGRNTAQRFLLMLGTPNGGKSTFMNILEGVIGEQNVVEIRTEHLSNRFELYRFVGRTLLTGKDVQSDFLLNKNAHVIKALVGHDTLSAEKKGHCEPVPLCGDFNLGVTCNADLNIRLEGDLGAWRRRMLVVRYERPAPIRRVADFHNRLLAEEGPGILRWMVEGAISLLKDIDEIGDYRLTTAQQARVDALLEQSDSVRHFVDRCVVAQVGNTVTVQDLKRAYLQYCEANGWIPMSASEVGRQLPDAILEIHRCRQRHDLGENKSLRGFSGVRIQQEVHNEVRN